MSACARAPSQREPFLCNSFRIDDMPLRGVARPRASPSASARCALRFRASRGGYRLGRALVPEVECKTRVRIASLYVLGRRGRTLPVFESRIKIRRAEGICMLFGASRRTPTCAKGTKEAAFGSEAYIFCKNASRAAQKKLRPF